MCFRWASFHWKSLEASLTETHKSSRPFWVPAHNGHRFGTDVEIPSRPLPDPSETIPDHSQTTSIQLSELSVALLVQGTVAARRSMYIYNPDSRIKIVLGKRNKNSFFEIWPKIHIKLMKTNKKQYDPIKMEDNYMVFICFHTQIGNGIRILSARNPYVNFLESRHTTKPPGRKTL